MYTTGHFHSNVVFIIEILILRELILNDEKLLSTIFILLPVELSSFQ